MAEKTPQAQGFQQLQRAEEDEVSERDDNRQLLLTSCEFSLERSHDSSSKRFWAGLKKGSAVVISALVLAAVARSLVGQAPLQPEVGPAMMQMKVANHACMTQCPKQRKLKEEQEQKVDPAIQLEQCMGKCPSHGFLATVEFESCKAACESKYPQSGKMAKMPPEGPPMEACKKKCADGLSGNFWRIRLERCANQCAMKTAAQEVMDQMKYNVSTKELRDLETEVVSVLKKRITFKKRPANRPFSQLIFQCKSTAEDALAEALGIPEGKSRPTVIMRPFQEGVHQVVSKAMEADPGNDLEAVVDVKALSGESLEKLSLQQTLKTYDEAMQKAISDDSILKDSVNLHPSLAMEITSASVVGDYESMGWHTVCRRDQGDQSLDGYGTARIFKHHTISSCSQLCNNFQSYCYGFEYRADEKRCEIWTQPICHSSQADISGSSFVDFRCFKRCQP